MVKLIVSQSCCSKAAKIFRKSTIFKHNSFTQHCLISYREGLATSLYLVLPGMKSGNALCCRARNLEFWEAVGRFPFDQRKFRKLEPVIFVEWKAPSISLLVRIKREQEKNRQSMTARGYCCWYLEHCSKTNHIAIKGVIQQDKYENVLDL